MFDFLPTPLAGLMVLERQLIADHRGFLSRLYSAEEFRAAGVAKPIAQMNHTLTRASGAVRGMHFQNPPHAEVKLVTCVKGEILDVAVDVRRDSPTFLQWHGAILTETNRRSLLIPEGFAHGFQALTANCELIYLHTAAYKAEAEGALNVSDPRLKIAWPLPIGEISDRDRAHPFVDAAFKGIVL